MRGGGAPSLVGQTTDDKQHVEHTHLLQEDSSRDKEEEEDELGDTYGDKLARRQTKERAQNLSVAINSGARRQERK